MTFYKTQSHQEPYKQKGINPVFPLKRKPKAEKLSEFSKNTAEEGCSLQRGTIPH